MFDPVDGFHRRARNANHSLEHVLHPRLGHAVQVKYDRGGLTFLLNQIEADKFFEIPSGSGSRTKTAKRILQEDDIEMEVETW